VRNAQARRYHGRVSATVNAKTLRATLRAARALGLDATALAEVAGLGSVLTDIDARFPHAAWLGLWQDTIRQTGSESIGIDAAERLPWGHWDVIDYLIGTADDLGAGLRRFERYFSVISTGVAHALEDHGGDVHLVRRYAPDCHTGLLAPAEFAFATIVSRFRMTLGFHWCPKAIHFAAPAPSTDAVHRRFFGCPIRFDLPTSAIVIDKAACAPPMVRPDAELGQEALELVCAMWSVSSVVLHAPHVTPR
jgi:hypothetical protein